MSGISDNTMQALQYAMGGLTTRAEVRATNIANAETPGYLAKKVNFESTLAAALKRGSGEGISAPSITNSDNLPNAQGNSVDMEVEVTEMLADDILYEAMVNSWTAKARNIRTAIGRG